MMIITTSTSLDSDQVTNLDYGEPPNATELQEYNHEHDEEFDGSTPRWNPDVADLVDSEIGTLGLGHCCWRSLPCIPSEPVSPAVPADADGDGRVDDAAIEAELAREYTSSETETEDEQEYFSAPSVPALSSGEEDEGDSTQTTIGK